MRDPDVVHLRTQLNELLFRQQLAANSAPLVAALLVDLIKMTGAYRDLQSQMKSHARDSTLHLMQVSAESAMLHAPNKLVRGNTFIASWLPPPYHQAPIRAITSAVVRASLPGKSVELSTTRSTG